MNVLDIVLIAPVCLGLVFGLFKGLIKELMSLAAIVLGIVGARWFEPQVSPWLCEAFNLQAGVAQAVAYLRKEALQLPSETPRGYVLLTYREVPLGFAKQLGNRANNLYPAEWRIRSGYLPEEVRCL